MPAFETTALTVRYGAFTALSGITAQFESRKIHAIVGQNGAGKTTYARVAAGLVQPAEGSLQIFGAPLAGGDVSLARGAGVELVHQNFALPPSFTVAEVLQFASPRRGVYSKRGLERYWQRFLDELGLRLSAGARIRDLPVELQQSAEIARAMVSDAKLLILDEPTAVLSPEGTERLFMRVRQLKEHDVTVMLVLHKIREVLAIADTITVLRGGKLIAACLPAAGTTAAALSELIVGDGTARISRKDRAALTGDWPRPETRPQAAPAERPALHIEAASTARNPGGPGLKSLSLDIKAGEIVGIAGVEGNGQRDLVAAIAGLHPLKAGKLSISGEDVTTKTLAERRKSGLRIIPFERNQEGLSLTSSLWENWCAAALVNKSLAASLRPAKIRSDADQSLKTWDVRFVDAAQLAGSLSGGNAQKVILAREIDDHAKLIIAAQPTRGLDIGATAGVWTALRDARDRGAGILLVSSDLDELFDICDRVVVMVSGQNAGIFAPPYDLAAVGHALTAAKPIEVAR